ncbi:MAG TPA: hypothetical protein VGP41_02050 [Candidatus Lustribacter sp.]|jgi:hypothetical protein|nr:hypothetical protein [Candidatus Lustribacter sp.]
MRLWLSFLRALAGTASAVVPFAIGVHLFSEGLALGPGAISPDFWLRHAYLLVPLALAAWSFSRTVGLGAGRSEKIRRCALVRAGLRQAGAASSILAFTVANLAFFGVTQLLEGEPIASGSIGTAIIAAVLGALASALAVFFWGRSFVATALAAAVRRPRLPRQLAFARRRIVDVPRAAGAAFSLFVPNRPPPIAA